MMLLSFFLTTTSLFAEELNSWPRDVAVASGTVTIYQPQVDSLEGDILTARAAVAYKAGGTGEPVFGASWLKGQVEIDRDERLVRYLTIEVTDIRFPKGSEQAGKEFTQAIKEGMTRWTLTSSLDDLKTSLAAAGEEQKTEANLQNDPPDIIYRDHPALLVMIDGKEQLQKIDKTRYQNVINTPYPLILNTSDNTWHLNAAEAVWYRAGKVDGPWTFNPNPPKDLVQMVQQQKPADDQTAVSKEKITADKAPEIVVVHQPSELIVSQGKANFKPLIGDLLAMSNTDSSVFMDVKEQMYYMVVAGRWYNAKSMDGTWSYIKSDQLPDSFADIPEDSTYSDIRAYVAGTDEADEALIDAQIPQTAAVTKGPVDIKVIYDGKPQFQKVDGTKLEFAINASETIIRDNTSYYLVKEGVWYLANAADGPWQVSDHAPPGIDKAEPTSPVYNTKYVYVYDSTPQVVYVGYTPGYMCSYVYGPTIVYGTGWYYRPWISPYYYYPRHATWGFSVNYNPWSGWGFGLGWNYGPFHFGWYSGGGWHNHPWFGRGWYGPGGYRPGFNNIRMGNVNINNTININRFNHGNNLYRHNNQAAKIRNTTDLNKIDRSALQGKLGKVHRSSQPNNVFTDKAGNIFRDNKGQWQERTGKKWSNAKDMAADRPKGGAAIAPVRPQNKPAVTRPATRPGRPTVAQPSTRPSKPSVHRPATQPSRPAISSRPASRPSGYSRPTGIQRQSHARMRSGGGGRGRR